MFFQVRLLFEVFARIVAQQTGESGPGYCSFQLYVFAIWHVIQEITRFVQ